MDQAVSTSSAALKAQTVTGPMTLLQGVDSVCGKGKKTLLTGTSVASNSAARTNIYVTTRTADLYTSLGLSAETCGQSALVSVSAKAEFLNSFTLSEYSVVVVLESSTYAVHSCSDYQPLSTAQLPNGDAASVDQFVREYGDSFVDSITLGASYYAIYNYQCVSQEQQQQVKAELDASGIANGAQVSVSLDTQFKKISSIQNTYCESQQISLGFVTALPDSAKMATFALEYPGRASQADDGFTVLAYTSKGYEEALPFGADSAFQKVIANRRLFVPTGSYTNPDQQGWMANYAALSQASAAAKILQGYYDFFGGYIDEPMNHAVALFDEQMDAITNRVDAWTASASGELPPLALSSLAFGSPSLSASRAADARYPQAGGSGGAVFDPPQNFYEFIYNRSYIRKMCGNWGSNGITQFEWQVSSAWADDATPSAYRYGNGGGTFAWIDLTAKNLVKEIDLWGGHDLNLVEVHDQEGNTARIGTESGNVTWPFLMDQQDGRCYILYGFKGRSGARVDALQAVAFHFNNATWSGTTAPA